MEYLVASLIDLVSQVTFVLTACVNRSPFSIPNAEAALVHPFPLLLIAASQAPLLVLITDILRGTWETKEGIIVDGISSIVPVFMSVAKVRKVGGKGVAVEEDDMVRILFSDDLVDLVVELDDPSVFGVGWFVQRVVSRNPFVALVVLRKLRPQPETTVLEVLEVPDYTARLSGRLGTV
jgi:hypothetical protein